MEVKLTEEQLVGVGERVRGSLQAWAKASAITDERVRDEGRARWNEEDYEFALRLLAELREHPWLIGPGHEVEGEKGE